MVEHAQPFTELVFGHSNVTVLENLATEQITMKTHHNDSTLKVRLFDETVILHTEVQTYNSRKPMPFRLAGYNGFLINQHQMPVYCCVIYLHPKAGANDPGYYAYARDGFEYKLRYKVIRLVNIEGQSILEAQVPGLLPLTPLMKPPDGMSPNRWLEECITATARARVDQEDGNLLLAALGIFGSLVYEPKLIRQFLPEGIMKESPFFRIYLEEAEERGLERGLEQGERKCAIESILAMLGAQFQPEAVQTLKPTLESIDDLQHLKQLLLAVPHVQTLEAFIQTVQK